MVLDLSDDDYPLVTGGKEIGSLPSFVLLHSVATRCLTIDQCDVIIHLDGS
jgi:hypothetical protein